MTPIKLIAHIEDHGAAGFVAWIDSIKGLVVHSDSEEGICKELFTSLKVKLAFDNGINPNELHEITEMEAKRLMRELALRKEDEKTCKKEFSLTLSC